MTPPGSTSAASTGGSGTAQLVEELKATTEAVRGRGWLSADLGSAGAELSAAVPDPLSALSSAGFGFITEAVSFLVEPLQQLTADPGAVSSGTQSFLDAGQAIFSTAASYQQAAASETGGWSGAAATGYLQTGAELVHSLNGLGQASQALAESAAGAGEAVAKTHAEVTVLINEAVGRIIMILNQAVAAAQATGGASIAAAIPQSVQVATDYGGRIAQKMQELLSSLQGLMQHVDSAATALARLTGTIAAIGQQASGGGGAPSGTASTSSLRTGSGDSSRDGVGEAQQVSPSSTGAASYAGIGSTGASTGLAAGAYTGTGGVAAAGHSTGGGMSSASPGAAGGAVPFYGGGAGGRRPADGPDSTHESQVGKRYDAEAAWRSREESDQAGYDYPAR
ncbi:hypothetical protein IQ251_15655 [Saccharopolyspora sp. HNM0983]|uniref:Uncharacterized protein n=1 Tax=Saccharopolyspora montiporae TaxID=2781240 RepID=A0A929BBN5_9PSEU|nr:hypothetical protein [Saccharopolyspora sp. HNM0983]MBE9375886.1 hypothetical protein [Saccharopolyspora sp. HNM0983]